jgi:hypothetical protein
MMAVDNLEQILRLVIPELGEDITITSFFTTEKTLHLPCPIQLVDLIKKMEKKPTPPPLLAPSPKRRVVKAGPVSTSTKQITSYTTVRGIYNEIKVREPEYPGFGVKELMENGYDFLQIYYPVEYGNTKETRKIAVYVKIEPILSVIESLPKPVSPFSPPTVITHIIRIAVRNSNVDKITVFEDLEAVFNYDNWFSTKRGQFRVTSGALGDYLKRSLGMGYALWTADFNPEDSLDSKQWNEPAIFRYNGKEHRVYIEVEPNQKIKPLFSDPVEYDALNFTEVEIALPVPTMWNSQLDQLLYSLRDYCRKARFSKIKTDISFRAEWDGGVIEL